MAAELPYRGEHTNELKAAKVLRQRLLEEQRVTHLLEAAIKTRDIAALRAAIAAAQGMTPPLVSAVLEESKTMVARLEEEAHLKATLQAVIKQRDKIQLNELLNRAQVLSLDCDETRQASMLLARLEEEEQVTISLRTAIADRKVAFLATLLSKASEMGLEIPEVAQAQALQKVLEAEALTKAAISDAIRERDFKALTSALNRATQVSSDDYLVCFTQRRNSPTLVHMCFVLSGRPFQYRTFGGRRKTAAFPFAATACWCLSCGKSSF